MFPPPFCRSAVRPLEVSVESVSRPLEAGKTGWLSCRAVGSRPRSRITWLLGDSALPGAKQNESLDGNVTLSLLALRPTAKHHGRLIRCRADNDLIPGSDIFAEFRLQVMCESADSVPNYSRRQIKTRETWIRMFTLFASQLLYHFSYEVMP